MNVEFKKGFETVYGDVPVGGVFDYDNALWVALNLDDLARAYPAMCIATDNDAYYPGIVEFIPNNTKVTEYEKIKG